MQRGYRVPIMQQDPRSNLPSVSGGIDLLRQDGTWPTRDLRDVQVTGDGVIRRRDGFTVYRATPEPAHSLFYFAGKLVYAIGELWMERLKVNGAVSYVAHNELCYGVHQDGMFYFDDALRVTTADSHGAPSNLSVSRKDDAASVSSASYGVAISIIDANGVESAAAFLGVFDKQANEALIIEGVPHAPEKKLVIYTTSPDGDLLRVSAEYPMTLPYYPIPSKPPAGRTCDVLDLVPMGGGHLITAHGSRLVVAQNEFISYSEAFRPHLTNPAHNYVRFSGRIRLLHSLGAVLYVADDRGVWVLRGTDPVDFKLELASSASVVAMSQVEVPGSALSMMDAPPGVRVLVFATTQGYCMATEDGNVKELHSDRVALREGLEGRSCYLRQNGIKQVVTLTRAQEVFPEHLADNYEDSLAPPL